MNSENSAFWGGGGILGYPEKVGFSKKGCFSEKVEKTVFLKKRYFCDFAVFLEKVKKELFWILSIFGFFCRKAKNRVFLGKMKNGVFTHMVKKGDFRKVGFSVFLGKPCFWYFTLCAEEGVFEKRGFLGLVIPVKWGFGHLEGVAGTGVPCPSGRMGVVSGTGGVSFQDRSDYRTGSSH